MKETAGFRKIKTRITDILQNPDDSYEIRLESPSKFDTGPAAIIASRKFLEQQKVWGSLMSGMDVVLTVDGEDKLVELKKILN